MRGECKEDKRTRKGEQTRLFEFGFTERGISNKFKVSAKKSRMGDFNLSSNLIGYLNNCRGLRNKPDLLRSLT